MITTVTLRPATKRLKQIITEHGAQWRVLEVRPVACFNGDLGVLIESRDGKHSRWVRKEWLQ